MFQGIVERIKNGVNENRGFIYQPIAGLITIGRTTSKDSCENNIHPVVISGTCKVEKGPEQAKVISTTLEAAERTKQYEGTIYRTVCIASDGEAKCGDTLVLTRTLSMYSSDSETFS